MKKVFYLLLVLIIAVCFYFLNNTTDDRIVFMLKDNEKKEFIKNFIKKIVLINDDPNKIKGKIKILNVEFYE